MSKATWIWVALSVLALCAVQTARARGARSRARAAAGRGAVAGPAARRHARGASTPARRSRWVRGRTGKTRFFDFDDLLIDGEFRKPATLYTRAMRSPRFDRLLRLHKSFLPALFQSLRDPSLRWIP